ncbi:MAG: glycosyltransferase family 4 protein, partial [Myxococcota bacterium]
CVLTQYYPPEMGAPQARLSELATRLSQRGWTVDVLTALPNYPSGRILDGYPRLRPVVEQRGVTKVARVPLYPSNTGFAKRLATYLSFAASASVAGPLLLRRPDLLWVESPPLFIGYAAWALQALWRCPYVLNVSDLWPESAIRMGIVQEGAATKAAEQLERALYARAAGVTGQSTGIIDGVRARCRNVATEVITNGVDPIRFGPQHADDEARRLVGPGPSFMYAGLFGYAQGLDQILDVAARVPNARFVLVGDGPVRADLEARVASESLTNVRLLPPQPRERIPALLACADAALITLGMSIPGAVPSKIYEAMAASLPIVLVADGEPAARVHDAGAGVAVDPGDAAGLEAAVQSLASDPAQRTKLGQAGRHAAETTYHRDQIAERLDVFLRSRLRS